jgi:hypothetical protein
MEWCMESLCKRRESGVRSQQSGPKTSDLGLQPLAERRLATKEAQNLKPAARSPKPTPSATLRAQVEQ